MVDHYEALDVARTAGTHAIKLAYDAKVAELESANLADKDRRAAERALSAAYYTLSNVQKRQEYDAKLAADERKSEVSTRLRPFLVPGVIVLVLVMGVALYASDRAKTRERIRSEEARIAREAEMAKINAVRDEAAAEERREQAARDEAQQRARFEREMNSARSSSRYESYDSRYDHSGQYQEQQRQREQQYAEERDRYQAEADRQRAIGEVERQKRFVQQRETEEEQARLRRYERVQQDERERAAREAAATPPPDTSTPLDPRQRKR